MLKRDSIEVIGMKRIMVTEYLSEVKVYPATFLPVGRQVQLRRDFIEVTWKQKPYTQINQQIALPLVDRFGYPPEKNGGQVAGTIDSEPG